MAEKHNIVLECLPPFQFSSGSIQIESFKPFGEPAKQCHQVFPPRALLTVKVRAKVLQLQSQNLDSLSSPENFIQAVSSTLEPSSLVEPSPPKALLITVQDEGKGIPEDKLETIFDQFEQLQVLDNEHQGGTGLGLAICRNIVEQHEGRIWAESPLGQGSTFFIALPISHELIPESSDHST